MYTVAEVAVPRVSQQANAANFEAYQGKPWEDRFQQVQNGNL
jgi:hypothetical protein